MIRPKKEMMATILVRPPTTRHPVRAPGPDKTLERYILDAPREAAEAARKAAEACKTVATAPPAPPRIKTPPKPNRAKIERQRRAEKAEKHAARRVADRDGISLAAAAAKLEAERREAANRTAWQERFARLSKG